MIFFSFSVNEARKPVITVSLSGGNDAKSVSLMIPFINFCLKHIIDLTIEEITHGD